MTLKITCETKWRVDYRETIVFKVFTSILKEYFKRSEDIHLMDNLVLSNSRILPSLMRLDEQTHYSHSFLFFKYFNIILFFLVFFIKESVYEKYHIRLHVEQEFINWE